MAELSIGALSLVGLLALFETCERAYDIFIRSARDLPESAYRLSVSLLVEQQKLHLWGQHLGISRGQQCVLLRKESYRTQCLVVTLLECIKGILDRADVILVRYGVRLIGEGLDEAGAEQLSLEGLDLQDLRTCEAVKIAGLRRRQTERSIVAATSRLGKLRWALSDNAKLGALVEDLRKINEDLWVALPRNQWLKLARGLPSVVLPGIEDQAALGDVEVAARRNETTEVLAACSSLRRGALTVAAHEGEDGFGDGLKVLYSQMTTELEFDCGDPSRGDTRKKCIVSITKRDGTQMTAILEWRYVDRSFDYRERRTIILRIKALAMLLSSEHPSELGILKCTGFLKDENSPVERYGLLFEHMTMPIPRDPSTHTSPLIDQLRPRSLHEYITITLAAKVPPDLGDRFRIAKALCNIVLQIHAAGWLHKAVQASNVLFFPSKPYSSPSDLNIAHPYLTGFDFSRPDSRIAQSLEVPTDRTSHDYRHPSLWPKPGAVQGARYRKQHDIYALGVVLLEIGLWRLVASASSSYRNPRDPKLWLDYLLEGVKSLGYRCGKVYQEVVQMCLTGNFVEQTPIDVDFVQDEEESAIKRSFLFDVVYELGKCHA